MKQPKLKPCPFCGNSIQTNITIVYGAGVHVRCYICNARGSSRDCANAAILAWNRRKR